MNRDTAAAAAAAADAAKRKEELDRKKAKLAEMKKANAAASSSSTAGSRREGDAGGVSPRGGADSGNSDHDQILRDLGIPVDSTANSFAGTSSQVGASRHPGLNGENSVASDGSANHVHAPSQPNRRDPPATMRHQNVSTDLVIATDSGVAFPAPDKSKETVSYSKETQTSGLERPSGVHDYYVLSYPDGEVTDDFKDDLHNAFHQQTERQRQLPKLPIRPATDQQQSVDEDHEEKHIVPDVTLEQKQEIMFSEDFRKFFDKASRVIERALAEDDRGIDIFVDYKGENLESLEGSDVEGLQVTLQRVFADEKNINSRGISSMDISTHFPELVIAAYNHPEENSNDPGGLACLWNLKFKKTTPEEVFRCHSALTAVSFAEFHPNLILGGTYSGQIVVWDNRVSKRTPINKSQVAVSTHCHPIFFLKVMGSSHAHNLVTASTDGRICAWSLDMLSQPQESLDLTTKQSNKVAVNCLSFPSDNWNNFLAGSEEGTVFAGCRHGNKPGVVETYEGHYGPVTAVSYNPAKENTDFSSYFLTSSFDWTVKLWSAKEKKPLYSFEAFSDNVYDVKWSPNNPAVFTTVDGSGSLDFWNLNRETEIPILKVPLEGSPSASRLLWTPSGQQLLVGDNSGKLHVYDVKEVAGSRADDLTQLEKTIQELRLRSQVTEEAETASAAVMNAHNRLDQLAHS
ncbi:Cytoplasmic dynein 1 intermediate chain 2 [Hypsibius exemplaris]|uniref:Cytoplasmic dynein 1 intermediate chain 2 n=1 Tax=Hypsibius exemplaris TaxID=2072580 RepID=A0A1W0X937_HYPEX|nr:Cytoplasmic dynein 1 intermediate chain 2 [Hypsibius exemplaris]